MTEYARQSLAKQITAQYAREHETLKVITCSGRVEKAIADGVQQTEQGNYLSLDPEVSDSIIRSVAKEAEQLSIRQESAILLCSPAVRMYVKQLLERYFLIFRFFLIMSWKQMLKYRALEWWIFNENKKFTAASMQDAAKQIKKELGNDAVILHSKQVKKRKWLGLRSQQAVEVIAVLDRDVRKRENAAGCR